MSQPATPRAGVIGLRGSSADPTPWRPPGRRAASPGRARRSGSPGVGASAARGGRAVPGAGGGLLDPAEDGDLGGRRPHPGWRVTGSEVGEAGRVMARGVSRVAHKGTVTEHASLEEEIAQLKGRIGVLMRAGTDYRRQVDELFLSTKEEARQELAERDAAVADARRAAEAAEQDAAAWREEAQRLGSLLGSTELELQQERQRSEAAVAAQQRVESELDACGRQQEEQRAADAEEARRRADQLQEAQRQLREALADLDAERQGHAATREDLGGREQQLRDQQAQLAAAEERARDAVRRAAERDRIAEHADAAQRECDSLAELIRALQERNREVETALGAARQRSEAETAARGELERAAADRERLAAELSSVQERLKRQEEQNRVLHRQADRRRQEAEELGRKLEAEKAESDVLRNQAAELLAADAAATVRSAAPPPPAPPQMRDAGVSCEPPGWGGAAAEAGEELGAEGLQALREVALLRDERQLLCDEREHERAQDEQVRQLCEELNQEVARLTADNQVLRDGLAMIEDCFGRFIPPEMKGRLDDSLAELSDAAPWTAQPEHSGSPAAHAPAPAAAPPRAAPGGAMWATREVFTQTLSADAPSGSSRSTPGGVWQGGGGADAQPRLEVSREAWHRVEMLELENAQLRQQQQLLQDAAASAFRRRLRDLLQSLRPGDPLPETVRVDVQWPERVGEQLPQRAVRTPLPRQQHAPWAPDAGAAAGRSPRGREREADALRRALRQAAAAEQRSDAACVAARQAAEECADLHEQLRAVRSRDASARVAHATAAATLQLVERRINAHLERWKSVLRRRAALVQRNGDAFARVADARGLLAEAELALERHPAGGELGQRLGRAGELLLDAEAAYRGIAAEFLTDWERAGLGLLGGEPRGAALGAARDLTEAMREQEELLRTLCIVIDPPGGPRRSSRGLSYAAAHNSAAGDGAAAAVRVGPLSADPEASPPPRARGSRGRESADSGSRPRLANRPRPHTLQRLN